MNRLRWLLLIGIVALSTARPFAEVPKPSSASEEAETLLSTIEKQCLEAQSAEELSALWVELNTLKSSVKADDVSGSPIETRLAAAEYFVGRWRDYLTARSSGNREAAFGILKRLLAESKWLGVIRRSEILNRYQDRYEYHPIEYSTATVADLPGVIEAYRKAALHQDEPTRMIVIADAYASLLETWELRKKGEWDRMVRACRIGLDDHSDFVRFKRLILAWAIAGYLDLPASYHFPPRPGATAPQHLDEIIALAQKNGDLVTLWRAMTFRSGLSAASEASRAEQKALDFYLTGRELEEKGAMERAVASYIEALKCPARGVAIEIATERLSEFRKSFPEAHRIGSDKKLLSKTRKPQTRYFNHKKPWTKY